MQFYNDLERASQQIRQSSAATDRALGEIKQTASQILVDMERARLVRQEQLREIHQNVEAMQETVDVMLHTESGRRG
ncbi:hypothetical protein C8R41DRAFT_65364 [Lentinula lateritia]|uniref:Uncharacterized protein n=1 Tax=Lentinula lateritia TaxID=40482 RepID=A0ABQ8V146_9AGAR|nr:hypothetical protein C8R41DRAFT_65364 [Lentinula lateritia]